MTRFLLASRSLGRTKEHLSVSRRFIIAERGPDGPWRVVGAPESEPDKYVDVERYAGTFTAPDTKKPYLAFFRPNWGHGDVHGIEIWGPTDEGWRVVHVLEVNDNN